MPIFDQIILGKSPELQAVVRAARLVAATDAPVLIQGETGTGKELLAQAIHQSSRRKSAPLVTVNCAALPETLVEAELFGNVKGAFTGAGEARPGKVRAAQGGTLLLDEVGELSLAVQPKLLRFLESGECQAVGDTVARRVEVRVIAATNRDLYGLVKQGRFRADLFHRLQVVPLELPPLRRRTGDVAFLMRHFLAHAATEHGAAACSLAPAAWTRLQRHGWPGNVRELRNLCARLSILHAGQEVTAEALPLLEPPDEAGELDFTLPEGGIDLEALERELLRQALAKARGNQSQAARLLGLSRDTFLYRLKKYAIPSS